MGQASVVVGKVTDAAGRALVGASVTLDDSVHRTSTTDSGTFAIRGVQPGAYTIRVRKIGHTPAEGYIRIGRGETVDRQFALPATLDTLAAVVVVGEAGERLPRKLVDFERRRTFGIGHFLGPRDIARAEGQQTSTLLRTLPGLVMARGAGGAQFAVNPRGPGGVRAQGATSCPVAVYVDGVRSIDSPFNVNSVQVGELSGVEYYAGSAEVPAQYSQGRLPCGVLIFWTK